MGLVIASRKNLGLLMLFCFLLSCKKAEERSCFKSSGEKVSKDFYVGNFNKLRLEKKLNYVLVQDDTNFVRIYGGKNLIPFVKMQINEKDQLVISNANKCNFLRDMENWMNIEIHFKDLKSIDYIGSGTLSNKDTLNLDVFEIVFLDASGSYDLTIDAKQFYTTVTDGMEDFKISGKADYANLVIRGNAYGDASALQVKNDLYISNKSLGDVYVNADGCNFSGYIYGKGNVYYKGNPLSKDLQLLGEGQFIPY